MREHNDAGRVGVIIPAAGTGTRMGGRMPKQFLRLGTRTVLEVTLTAFDEHPGVSEIVIVTARDHLRRVALAAMRLRLRTPWGVIVGGGTRQESVWNGLHAFEVPPDLVLVHDAVRPLVSARLISKTISETRRHGAAVVCVRVKDTVKLEQRGGFSSKTVDRSKLWAAQTPQGFTYHLIMEAQRRALRSGFLGTDEASLVERMRVPVRIVEGEYTNIKITTPADMIAARAFLATQGKRRGDRRQPPRVHSK